MGNLTSSVGLGDWSSNQFTTISHFDHAKQLSQTYEPNYSTVIEPADPSNDELGPVRGTLVGRKDGTVAQQFKKGFEWSKTEQRYDLYSAFLKGLELAGDDAPFAATRVWKQDESTKSGYQQRKDSTINRFEYKALSYAETNNMAMNFGRGLVSLGIQPKTPVSIFAANSPEWLVYLFGLYTQSMPCIPLYPSLGPDSLEYILNLAQTECLVVSVENIPAFNKLIEKEPHIAELVKNLIILDCIADAKFGNVKHVVQGDLRNDLKSKYDINVYGMSEIIEFGAKNQQIPLVESQGDDVAFIMFTSGTTGNPKGVVLTHTNITSCAGCVGDIVQLDPAIRMFIFLPLQHIFSVVLCGICILVGGTIYFSQGDVKQIASDMLECKPQILPSVPRIFQKFFQIIWATVDQMPFYKRWYITNAYNYQLYQARNGLPLDPTYDQKVFSQFREKLGLDECKIVVVGGSPTPGHIYEFIKVLLFDGWAVSGYGSTESSAGVSITTHGDYTVGSIGSTIPALHWRLASVPDLEYFHSDDKGELLVHGSTTFTGYFKNDEETAKAFVVDSKGRQWYRTGDIARINPNGGLSIIDRKKSLLKLSQGEYVALERLLNIYSLSPLVSQIFIYGNSFKSALVAVVSPNHMPLYTYAKEKGWWSITEVPVAGSLTPAVLAEFTRLGQEYQQQLCDWVQPSLKPCEVQLLGFEKIRQIYVETHYNDALGQSWNEQNNLITPTLKLKYGPLSKHYLEVLKDLYEKLGEPTNPSDVWY